jgi:hypothetical protein
MMRALAVVTLAVAAAIVAPVVAGAKGLGSDAKATFVGSIKVSGKKATL